MSGQSMLSGVFVSLPIRTVSESNARGHWAKRASRAKVQRRVAGLAVVAACRTLTTPATVTLTRVAPRALDDDNLRGALKAIRDGVADAFGIDDRDPGIVYVYGQRRGAKGAYAVEVTLQATGAGRDPKRDCGAA